MKFWEFYSFLKQQTYTKSGDAVDWCIVEYKNIIMLLFQESKERRDWINNFNFPIMPYKEQSEVYFVARGWGKAYKSCNDEIMSAYINAVNAKPNCKTLVAGFSYGSAMTLLAMEDYWYRTGKEVDGVITYGSVKPLFGCRGKKHYAKGTKRVLQFCHVWDIITKCVPLLGYCRLTTTKLGKHPLAFWHLFNPNKWHQCYGDETLYTEKNYLEDIEEWIDE